MSQHEVYLGDGLFASWDGWQIRLRAPREGVAESLYPELAKDPAVSVASPVLELAVALPGRRDTLKIIGVDPFLAATLQPALMGDIGSGIFDLFQPDSLFLSQSAAEQLQVRRGDLLPVVVGSSSRSLRVLGVLAQDTYSQALGIMDIASAQWTFNQLGRLNRVDLRIAAGHDVEAFRSELSRRLPAGVLAVAPQIERDRAAVYQAHAIGSIRNWIARTKSTGFFVAPALVRRTGLTM